MGNKFLFVLCWPPALCAGEREAERRDSLPTNQALWRQLRSLVVKGSTISAVVFRSINSSTLFPIVRNSEIQKLNRIRWSYDFLFRKYHWKTCRGMDFSIFVVANTFIYCMTHSVCPPPVSSHSWLLLSILVASSSLMHQALAFVLNFYFILHNNFLNKAFRANLAWFALSDLSISYLVYFPTPATSPKDCFK